VVNSVSKFEGLGSYSWFQGEYNQSRAEAIGFKTNWDLSGTWMPYDGLFLPYGDLKQWPNLGPINGGLRQYNVSFERINTVSAAAAAGAVAAAARSAADLSYEH